MSNGKIYQDKEIQCYCGDTFVFTAGEQEFYERKGLNDPKRCEKCKAKKRAFFDKKESRGDGPALGAIDGVDDGTQ